MTQTSTPAARLPFATITVSDALRQGLTPRRMTAEALHAWLPADGSLAPMWERIGYIGRADVSYGITHFRRSQTPGHPGVEVVREDGSVVIRLPLGQGRTVRILGKAG